MRDIIWLGAVSTLLVLASCGDDTSDGSPASGGTSGIGATGGTSGAGANAGTSGTGANAGASGTGGAAGTTGGASGAGAGGAAAGAAGHGGVDAGAGAGGRAAGAGGDDAGLAGSAGSAGGGAAGADGGAGAPTVTLTAAERAMLATMTPLPALPPDPTNAVADDPAARALGQRLFFDEQFSGALKVDSDLGLTGEVAKVSCASCHSGSQLDDRRSMPRTVSLGADFHTRNAPPLVNSAFYRWTNWGGRFSAPWELPLPVSESGVIMNGNRLQIVHRIFDVYRADYETLFGPMDPALGSDPTRFPAVGKPKASPASPDGAWEGMAPGDQLVVNRVFVNFGKVLQAYMRQLVSRNAPFDAFMAGDTTALGAAELRGAQLFVGRARCNSCHLGPHLSDDRFHNLGVPQTGERVPASDDGRFKDVPPLLASPFNTSGAFSDDPNTGRLLGLTSPMSEDARGAFRTPGLRGVALTEPYMHSGQIATLEDVVEFYDQGGGTPAAGTRDPLMAPLYLTAAEKSDLVAFLRALTGNAVPPALLVDTAAP